MSVEIIELRDEKGAAFYCNTSDTFFGPKFDNKQHAKEFFNQLRGDPRKYSDDELQSMYLDFKENEKYSGKE